MGRAHAAERTRLARRRVALLVAACALGACTQRSRSTGQVQRTEPAQQPLAAQASTFPQLPQLERERLRYLFAAAELVAHTWPELDAAQTCILLVAQDRQWVVNCDTSLPGFKRTADAFRARPIFAHRGGDFEVGGERKTTRALLEKTPAAAHLSNASSGGLPAGKPWLLLGTLEALRAFHPAFGPAVTESWLSVAMHELVHIHQLRQPEFAPFRARIEAGTLSPAALDALYASDSQLHGAIAREYRMLSAVALRQPSPPSAAADALREWSRSYRTRIARIARRPDGAQLLEDERVFTYLEGVARFVESDFLANTSQHPQAGLEDDPEFHHFAAFVGHGYAASPNRQLDAQYYYAIGYHLCVLLERVDPSWKRRVDAQPGWLIGLVDSLR